MACITLLVQPMAMATTQLARAVRHEDSNSWPVEWKSEFTPLRMNWVVVTDEHGKRQLRMRWVADGA